MMRIFSLLLLALALFSFSSCRSEKVKADPAGCWADSSGMALFQVKQETGPQYSIHSPIGSLKGTLEGSTIRGVTDLNDPFTMDVRGDSAVYTVLGVQIYYRRVSQGAYDSLAKILE